MDQPGTMLLTFGFSGLCVHLFGLRGKSNRRKRMFSQFRPFARVWSHHRQRIDCAHFELRALSSWNRIMMT
ncbi:TPA: hypothetical protein N0F65_007612 [Lagenidium giganteum]|uniref:Secreted protein n=1 Tax=Lagenidium giganteum TaxID=4803 RepID=A0AAV2ZT07_9STRA|nr:TPA: hypothetical protein N0F65_007612 [Lagenidium giganteum]